MLGNRVETGCSVGALIVRQEAHGKGVFERLLQLTGLDAPEVELHVDEIEFHARSLRINAESATKTLEANRFLGKDTPVRVLAATGYVSD